MKIIKYKNYRPRDANPFSAASVVNYDSSPALTDRWLLLTNSGDIPKDWQFAPHQIVAQIGAKKGISKLPECGFAVQPLLALEYNDDRRFVYFDRGQCANATYFDAVMNLYPTAEWFVETDDINSRLEAKVQGGTVAILMPRYSCEFPKEIESHFAHLKTKWLTANDDFTRIETINAVHKPFNAFKTAAELKSRLKALLDTSSLKRQSRLMELRGFAAKIERIEKLVETLSSRGEK